MKIKIVRNLEILDIKLFDKDMQKTLDCTDRILSNIREMGAPQAVSILPDNKNNNVRIVIVGNKKKIDKIYDFMQENIIRKPKKAGR